MFDVEVGLRNLDFVLLRAQKRVLVALAWNEKIGLSEEQTEALEGIICLIDAVQDEAAKFHSEVDVFGPRDGDGYLDEEAEEKIQEAWRATQHAERPKPS